MLRRPLCLAGALALLLSSETLVAADEPLAQREFEFPDVQAAWDAGGADGVKDWMKAMLKSKKKAGRRIASTGKKLKCGSCHESLKTYELSPNATADLQALLAEEP